MKNSTGNILVLNPLILLFGGADLKFGKKILAVVFSLLIFSLIVFYVFQVNSLTLSGYSLQDYQKSINKMAKENETLERNIAGTGLFSDIENMTAEFGFEKINKINYIQTIETSVASAK